LQILVVDDELSMREYLDVLLTRAGYQVTTASSVKDALAHLEGDPIDLVISDMRLGQESGLSILKVARANPVPPEVILITDPEHAVPVRIERTGLRTIAVGAGDTTSLALPYLPANADIQSGDLLVTSGLGGVFPEGYPVARVIEVHRDAVQPLGRGLHVCELDHRHGFAWTRSSPKPQSLPWTT